MILKCIFSTFFLMQEKLSNPTIWLILQGCHILLPRVAPLVNQKADGIIMPGVDNLLNKHNLIFMKFGMASYRI